MNAFNRLAIRTVVFCLFFLTFLFYHGVFSSFNIINSNSQPLDKDFDERLFESDVVLKLTIISDFASIMDDRGEDRSYHKGELYYLNFIGDTIRRKVRLKTRGNFRRDPTNCKYPPIMVKFGKLKTADSIFTEQSNLKLVTQCQLENYVLLEYLAYKIYGLFSSHSYRVRLAHITYVDMDTRESYFTRYGFFIEDEAEMVVRIHAKVY